MFTRTRQKQMTIHSAFSYVSQAWWRHVGNLSYWCSELSSGIYCRVKWLSTKFQRCVLPPSVGRQSFYTAVYPRRQLWTSYSPPWELEFSQSQPFIVGPQFLFDSCIMNVTVHSVNIRSYMKATRPFLVSIKAKRQQERRSPVTSINRSHRYLLLGNCVTLRGVKTPH
jgi:hypothetical protein